EGASPQQLVEVRLTRSVAAGELLKRGLLAFAEVEDVKVGKLLLSLGDAVHHGLKRCPLPIGGVGPKRMVDGRAGLARSPESRLFGCAELHVPEEVIQAGALPSESIVRGRAGGHESVPFQVEKEVASGRRWQGRKPRALVAVGEQLTRGQAGFSS